VVRNGVHRATARQKLDRFCEVLVDYVSAGHFEIYCALLDEGERFGAKRCREAADLYARIVPTTAVALDFNDHYFNAAAGARSCRTSRRSARCWHRASTGRRADPPPAHGRTRGRLKLQRAIALALLLGLAACGSRDAPVASLEVAVPGAFSAALSPMAARP